MDMDSNVYVVRHPLSIRAVVGLLTCLFFGLYSGARLNGVFRAKSGTKFCSKRRVIELVSVFCVAQTLVALLNMNTVFNFRVGQVSTMIGTLVVKKFSLNEDQDGRMSILVQSTPPSTPSTSGASMIRFWLLSAFAVLVTVAVPIAF